MFELDLKQCVEVEHSASFRLASQSFQEVLLRHTKHLREITGFRRNISGNVRWWYLTQRHRFIIKLSFVFSHTTDIWGERAKIERRSSAHQPTSTKDWVNFSVKMTENNLWNVDYSIISSKNHNSQRNWGFQIENNFSIKLLNSLAINTWMCIRAWKQLETQK